MINKEVCPYCGKLMIKGYIKISSGVLAWTPDGVRKSIFLRGKSNLKKGEVLLADFTLFTEAKAIAYRCPECKKVIIDEPEDTN